MIKVKLSKWQKKVADDDHRFKVICAGRRSGKSVLARLILLKWAAQEAGVYYLVSPTYKQAKSIHWYEAKKEIPKSWIKNTNNTELSFTLKNGSIIELKGAENPDTLRGVKLRGLVIDEIASIRNWTWLWSEVLRPTLTDYEAPAIFISTPKGYNHFYDLYQSGQNKDSDYKSWRFTSYDNPYIPKKEIDNAKKELTEDTFAQEYLAKFTKFTGMAHKPWDRDIHIIEPFDIPENWQYVRGFDFGSTHFTASVRAAVNEEVFFIDSCYMDNSRITEEHAKAILAQDFGKGVVPTWGDPSGKQWIMDLAHHGLSIKKATRETGQANKSWVELCVEKVNERLKPIQGHDVYLPTGEVIHNAPYMFVFNNKENEPFIKQIENLKWRASVKGSDDLIQILDEADDPIKGGHYDLMAALRYLAISYTKSDPHALIKTTRHNKKTLKKWEIK